MSDRRPMRMWSARGLVGALLTLMLLSGCSGLDLPKTSSRSAEATATPFPTPFVIPTITPAQSPTPLPSVAPVTAPAGWSHVVSPGWSGETFPISNVTGIQAQWREPDVSDAKGVNGAAELTWIGLGGWLNDTVIQLGTFVLYSTPTQRVEEIWYEITPGEKSIQRPGIGVNSGDYLFAQVEETSASEGLWRLLLVDVTTGATFDRTIHFISPHSYPDVIVADPGSTGGHIIPLRRWAE